MLDWDHVKEKRRGIPEEQGDRERATSDVDDQIESEQKKKKRGGKTYVEGVCDGSREVADGDLGGAIDHSHNDIGGLADEALRVDDGGRDRRCLAHDGPKDVQSAVAGSTVMYSVERTC